MKETQSKIELLILLHEIWIYGLMWNNDIGWFLMKMVNEERIMHHSL